jgi:hypothetical protein
LAEKAEGARDQAQRATLLHARRADRRVILCSARGQAARSKGWHRKARSPAFYGAVEIASLVMIWLVFFPPAIYRRWFNGDASVKKVGGLEAET